MSKPSSSICNRVAALPASLLLIAACLSPRAGQDETTIIELTSTGDDTSGASEPVESTPGSLMTTTEDPDDDSTGDPATTTDEATSTTSGEGTTTTGVIPEGCGNGVVEGAEQCDDGPANANDAACTSTCKTATCGDGLLHSGFETCDDGADNGDYDKCADDCSGPGLRCGDLVIQMQYGEQCDTTDLTTGCTQDCKRAGSCLALKESWQEQALDGMYAIWPNGPNGLAVDVHCDMTTDGGGYTFLKYANLTLLTASGAEDVCAALGLQLIVPRSPGHLASMAKVAVDGSVVPLGAGEVPVPTTKYLNMFGIYPKTPMQSCVGAALNSASCAEWVAGKGGKYWVSEASLDGSQPSTDNCNQCSMSYAWSGDPQPVLLKYSAFSNGGDGATSKHFMCDVGDKMPPMDP